MDRCRSRARPLLSEVTLQACAAVPVDAQSGAGGVDQPARHVALGDVDLARHVLQVHVARWPVLDLLPALDPDVRARAAGAELAGIEGALHDLDILGQLSERLTLELNDAQNSFEVPRREGLPENGRGQ